MPFADLSPPVRCFGDGSFLSSPPFPPLSSATRKILINGEPTVLCTAEVGVIRYRNELDVLTVRYIKAPSREALTSVDGI